MLRCHGACGIGGDVVALTMKLNDSQSANIRKKDVAPRGERPKPEARPQPRQQPANPQGAMADAFARLKAR